MKAILSNLKRLVYPLTWGGPGEGVAGGFDYPPMARQADETHAQAGLVTWAHFPGPHGELAVDIALGKIDSIDLFTWGDAFREDSEERPGPARTWYRFLNCGFRIPATAGTDKMYNTQIVGSVRTYVKVDGDFSYQGWIDGIRDGRTFVTTGPMLKITAGGKELGETIQVQSGSSIPVRAKVTSATPIERLEIVQGGNVVAVQGNPSGLESVVLNASITADESTWIAARAYSSKTFPYQSDIPLMAHTSPFYVEVPGSPLSSPEDAAFLARWCARAIKWVETQANVHEESQRNEMIALFRRAKAVYERQIANQ